MFIKASSEYQDRNDPIHKQSADHKRLVEKHIAKLAKNVGLAKPAALSRQLLLLKEGAIVTAHLGHTEKPARDAKLAAICLIDSHSQ